MLVYWQLYASFGLNELVHWGRVTQICVSQLSIIGSDNGLSPDRCQAIAWTNDGIIWVGTLGTNLKSWHLHSRKCIRTYPLGIGGQFVLASVGSSTKHQAILSADGTTEHILGYSYRDPFKLCSLMSVSSQANDSSSLIKMMCHC